MPSHYGETFVLVEFLIDLQFQALPPEVVETAKLCLLDTLGAGLYARQTPCVQFFFNETKSKDEVSRFWLWDSHRENPVGDVEKRLPYLPQDRRSRSDPYLGIPPR